MNKDTQTTEYIEKLKNLKLSSVSRERIKKNLESYAAFHSVRVAPEGRSIEQVPQRTTLLTLFNLSKKPMTALLIAVLVVIGGGTSYAAQTAVPGDFLYPVKTEVNENIESAFAG